MSAKTSTDNSTPQRPRNTAELAHEIRVVILRLARRLRQLAPPDLTPTQLSTMHSIGRNAPIGNADLAAIERVSPPAMCRIIDSLDNEGWVERSRDPEDRRAVQIELSPEGKELLEAARKRRTAFLNQRLESLGADERERLSGAVEILWALLDDDTAAAPSFDNAPRDAPGDAPGNEPGNDT